MMFTSATTTMTATWKALRRSATLARCFSASSTSTTTLNPSPSGKIQVRADLSDTFGRKHDYLRISLTEKCSLRCLYCMPEEGVQLTPSEKLLSTEEIIRLAQLFVHRFGVRKIRLTGGEPLVRRDVLDIVQQLNQLKADGLEKIALTTNGIVFARHCAALRAAGLDSVNISLDTLKADRFEAITRRKGLKAVLKSIEAAVNESFDAVKLNIVPMKGINEDEVEDFVQLTKNVPLEVRFIEYMPFDGNRWAPEKMLPYKELFSRIRSRFPGLHQLAPASPNETSKTYQVDGFQGTVGFISSMTNAFCSSCNRIRLTADGHLKVCLFGQEEVSLKDAMRRGDSDEQVAQMIVDAVLKKKKQHAGALNIAKNAGNRPMILIGQSTRHFSSDTSALSHIDPTTGRARMVNIAPKQITTRTARAQARIHLGPAILSAIESNSIAKGDVFTVAKVAAITATKRTGDLIPLCHPLPLDSIDLQFTTDHTTGEVIINSTVTATYKTGVEMEALTAVSIAALTIYDMCKSIDKRMVIREVRLVAKSGGKSDFDDEQAVEQRRPQ